MCKIAKFTLQGNQVLMQGLNGEVGIKVLECDNEKSTEELFIWLDRLPERNEAYLDMLITLVRVKKFLTNDHEYQSSTRRLQLTKMATDSIYNAAGGVR